MTRLRSSFWFVFIALAVSSFSAPLVLGAAAPVWKVKKDHWALEDELKFQKFVAAIGESQCHSLNACLNGPANPYRGSETDGYSFNGDCADLPYVLRAYFAWKNELPFSFVLEVEALPSESGSSDIRYSPNGNRPTVRRDVLAKTAGKFPNPLKVITNVREVISTAMFRFDPSWNDSRFFSDFYPVKIDRTGIVPGTVIYDPAGHVAMVYKVGSDGRVFFMDTHPDGSLTHGVYGKKFARSRPGAGAGFKRFRPLKLVDAQIDADGVLLGGRFEAMKNEELPDFSVVQFYGNQPDPGGAWRKGRFVIDGKVFDYYDFVRIALALGELRFEPLGELTSMLNSLCSEARDRVTAVAAARNAQIDLKAHPERLPLNIYGTEGEWEIYSTPSRDARLKTSFKEARDRVQDFMVRYKKGDPMIEYHGRNLARDMLAAFSKQTQACTIQYERTDASVVKLNLEEVMRRLFALSFDPYHCVELRWGATDPQERATCLDDALKLKWYDGEQFLRNEPERNYDARMDFSVDELFILGPGNGEAQPPEVDIRKLLEAQF
ncbi:hypothetical protein WDW86_09745 [Bdellovibrionota bacterium FG-2]